MTIVLQRLPLERAALWAGRRRGAGHILGAHLARSRSLPQRIAVRISRLHESIMLRASRHPLLPLPCHASLSKFIAFQKLEFSVHVLFSASGFLPTYDIVGQTYDIV